MKVYSWPMSLSAVIFDIDGTLYADKNYEKSQIDSQIFCYAESQGISLERALALIEEARMAGGKRLSLGNALKNLGVPVEKSVEWRLKMIHPEEYLKTDPKLAGVLAQLRKKFRICALTNNPSSIGWRTLAALGIKECFEFVIGLEDSLESKPSRKSLQIALDRLRMECRQIGCVGDRYEVDLELPLSLGMGGLLVDGPSDIIDFFSRL